MFYFCLGMDSKEKESSIRHWGRSRCRIRRGNRLKTEFKDENGFSKTGAVQGSSGGPGLDLITNNYSRLIPMFEAR